MPLFDIRRLLHSFSVGLTALVAAWLVAPAWANPALEGYSNYAQFAERVTQLDASELVAVTSLAKTPSGREIQAITIAQGDAAKKPAIVVIGNVEAGHVVGSELALQMAERLVAESDKEEVRKLLDTLTIYVIPRPDPDATEKAFIAPYREVVGNLTPTDDDRDGRAGEDPPEDLNGDGYITMMRIADKSGRWMPHPSDPRVLIEADPKKNERGTFRLLTEGRDNDGDEQFNEDAGDGVAFDRNWPHRYEPFQPGTGPHAVSEAETRAVANFLYDHPNIFAVFCFSPHDNLFHPWKPDAGKEKQQIRTTVLSADAPYLDFLAGKYRELHGGKDAPESSWPGGTFAEWSYYQFGRWAFSARGWWVPKVGESSKDEKRGADDLNALRWFEQEKIDGFVAWQKIEHPEFLGKTVEVGGFKPYYRQNPPAKMIDELVNKHVSFLTQLAVHRPQAAIGETKVERLGEGLFRIATHAESRGYLPTMSEMGEVTKLHQRLQMQLVVPEKTVFVKGSPRVKLDRIESDKPKEVSWLVRLPEDAPREAKLRLWSPEVSEVEQAIELQ